MDRKPVDFVRIPREEKIYDREDVLGRDAASVFPTESKKAFQESDAVKSLLAGNRKFITETELNEIHELGINRPEDGSIAADKPLAEVLREAKEAKDAAFKEQWRQMKTGKNRPLDEDELEFYDNLAETEAQQLKRVQDEEARELAAFQAMQQEAEEAKRAAAAAEEELQKQKQPIATTAATSKASKAKTASTKPQVKRPAMVVRVEPKAAAAKKHKTGVDDDGLQTKTTATDGTDNNDDGSDSGGGLGALLGGYGSDSE